MGIIYFTISSAIFCIILLNVMILITLSKLRKDFSKSKGSSLSGIIYALTAGMLPKAKESASKHLLSYLAGILFHIGLISAVLFTIIICLFVSDIVLVIPDWFSNVISIIISIGFLSGFGLLIKRIINKRLRAISHFDDYFSNILVNLFLLSVLAVIFLNSESMVRIMYLIEGILFIYIPFGKLRHSVYFFATRIMFGSFYGRRGVINSKKIIDK